MFRRGFTLVEMLVVVAMIGALSAIVIVQFTGAQKHARDTKRREDAVSYQTALEVYANNHSNKYPATNATVDLSSICGSLGITNCPVDSTQTGTDGYKFRSDFAGTRYILYVTTEDPKERWIICSNGNKGTRPYSWSPTSSACPV